MKARGRTRKRIRATRAADKSWDRFVADEHAVMSEAR